MNIKINIDLGNLGDIQGESVKNTLLNAYLDTQLEKMRNEYPLHGYGYTCPECGSKKLVLLEDKGYEVVFGCLNCGAYVKAMRGSLDGRKEKSNHVL